jgi:hypothetical protein
VLIILLADYYWWILPLNSKTSSKKEEAKMRRSLPDDIPLVMPFDEYYKLNIRWTDYSKDLLFLRKITSHKRNHKSP